MLFGGMSRVRSSLSTNRCSNCYPKHGTWCLGMRLASSASSGDFAHDSDRICCDCIQLRLDCFYFVQAKTSCMQEKSLRASDPCLKEGTKSIKSPKANSGTWTQQ